MDALVGTATLPLFTGEQAPRTFGELEAALGLVLEERDVVLGFGNVDSVMLQPLSAAVQSLSAKFPWDMHHERPVRTLDDVRPRSVLEFDVWFLSHQEACEARLRARYGAPATAEQRTEHGSIAYSVYGPFFLSQVARGGFALRFYRKIPDWALPQLDEEARAHFLAELLRPLEQAQTFDDVLAQVASPPPGSGVVSRGGSPRNGCQLELLPPMPAAELCRIWNWQDAFGKTVDVHMSSWELRLPTLPPSPAGQRPAFGKWEIVVRLEQPASGGDVPGAPQGGTRCRHLGGNEQVRYFGIHQRR